MGRARRLGRFKFASYGAMNVDRRMGVGEWKYYAALYDARFELYIP